MTYYAINGSPRKTHNTATILNKALEGVKAADPQAQTELIHLYSYNTIKLFVDYNLVIELKNGDGSTHYDYFGRPHYHVVCDNCGRITDVFDEHFSEITKELSTMTREKTHYLVTGSNIEIHGLCPDCQRKLHLNQTL